MDGSTHCDIAVWISQKALFYTCASSFYSPGQEYSNKSPELEPRDGIAAYLSSSVVQKLTKSVDSELLATPG